MTRNTCKRLSFSQLAVQEEDKEKENKEEVKPAKIGLDGKPLSPLLISGLFWFHSAELSLMFT